MASLVLGVVGTAIGGPVGGFIGGTIGGYIDQLIFGPKDRVIEGPRLNDLKVTSSAYGRPIPLIYGRMRVGGNVVWSPGIKEHRIEETEGGKGGPEITTVTFKYTASFRINYCAGPIAEILRVWADGKLILDRTGSDAPITGVTDPDLGVPAIRDYFGTESQDADPAEQADKGVANAPAYRGLAGQVFQDLPLANFGNRIPQVTAEVTVTAIDEFPKTTISPTGPGLTFAAYQPGNRTYISHNGIGDFSRIDVVGQRELINASPGDGPDFPAVDAEGNYYSDTEFSVNLWKIQKYDGTTFVLLSEIAMVDPFTGGFIASSVGWTLARVFGGLPLPDGTRVGELIVFLEAGNSTEVVVAEEPGTVINHYDAPTALSSGGAGITVDGERHAWIFSSNVAGSPQNETILYRIEPGSGNLVETHTLPGETADHITYEPSTNSIILGKMSTAGSGSLIRWDIDTQTIEARLDDLTMSTGTRNESAFWNGPTGGRMWIQKDASGDFTAYDVVNMTVVREYDNTDFGLDGDVEFALYDPINHAVIGRDVITGDLIWRYLDRASGGDVTVRTIVEDVSSRVGLAAGTDIDATALTDTLPGYVVDRRMAARRALEPLAAAFTFRGVESDDLIKFPKRGGASVFAIPEADLGAAPGLEAGILLEERRIQEVELPEILDVVYADPAVDYQEMIQQAKRIREAVSTRAGVSVVFPGALTQGQAARIAERLLFLAWQGRDRYRFKLTWEHARLDPADVGTVTKDGVTFTVELLDTDYRADGVVDIAALSEDSVIYDSAAAGAGALGFPPQSVTVPGPSALYLLDTPLLRDADEGLGVYVAAGAFGDDSWSGASVYKSTDGFTFTTPFTFLAASRNVAHGYAATVLADNEARTWDRANTVTVRLFRGTLSSATEINVLNGSNALLIGDEVVQFATATLNSDGTYSLSTLLRGRRGTEWATGGHAVGDRVVVLSSSTLLKESLPDSDLNVKRFYKAITVGGTSDNATIKELVFLGRALMPYSPVDIRGSLGGSPRDWTGSWKRRTRLNGSWRDLVDVPLGEDTEDYELDVLDDGAVVRTITTAASANGSVVDAANRTFIYVEQDQLDDLGDLQTPLTVKVYQLSAIVGRGFAGDATLGDTDPFFANVVLLLPLNGADGATTTKDRSNSAHAATFVNQAQLDTAQKKFGTASLLCDGVDDGLSFPDSADWNLGAGPFTAECHVRVNAFGSFDHLVGHFGNTGGQQSWELTVDNTQVAFRYKEAVGALQTFSVAQTLSLNTWYHLCAERDEDNNLRLYVDGLVIGTRANVTETFQNVGVLFTVGKRDVITGQNDFDGWIDNVRVTKGIARYQGSFTPPTLAFPVA
ncbi:MAG: phage tail protein [Kiloniellaceae bacterium]